MTRDRQPNNRGERVPDPPSTNRPKGNNRQEPERGRLDVYNHVADTHRIRSERQIQWENDLYERQSI